MKCYRLLNGSHIGEGNKYYKARTPGKDIVETNIDLVTRFGADKFECLGEATGGGVAVATAPKITREELNQMTVADLKEFAEEEEIDVEGVTKKEELVNTILHSLDAR